MHVAPLPRARRARGKRVLVLGIGNSATDIAVESSRIADKTFLAMRRGAYDHPQVPLRQADRRGRLAAADARCRSSLQRSSSSRRCKPAAGMPTAYGLPEPDHKLLEAHPTVSSDLLAADRPRRHHGQAEHRPLRRAATVRFADGSRGADRPRRLLHGLQDHLPVLRPASSSRRPTTGSTLYRRVVDPDHPGLYFIGLIQPLGAIMPLAEAQSEWVADLLEGEAALPPPRRDAPRDRARERANGASATSPPSATRSRSTSTPTCERSSAERRAGAPPRPIRPPARPPLSRAAPGLSGRAGMAFVLVHGIGAEQGDLGPARLRCSSPTAA